MTTQPNADPTSEICNSRWSVNLMVIIADNKLKLGAPFSISNGSGLDAFATL